jgi:hypothetical protein
MLNTFNQMDFRSSQKCIFLRIKCKKLIKITNISTFDTTIKNNGVQIGRNFVYADNSLMFFENSAISLSLVDICMYSSKQ